MLLHYCMKSASHSLVNPFLCSSGKSFFETAGQNSTYTEPGISHAFMAGSKFGQMTEAEVLWPSTMSSTKKTEP